MRRGVDASQLNRLNFADEPIRLTAQERRHDLEHGVAKSADVQTSLRFALPGAMRLDVGAHQLRAGKIGTVYVAEFPTGISGFD